MKLIKARSSARRQRDQAASVTARRPLIAAAGDVRTAPRLGCCLSVAAATAAAAMQWWQHRRQHSPNPRTFPFFSLFLLPVHCACRIFAWWVACSLPFYRFPSPLSPLSSPLSPHPSFHSSSLLPPSLFHLSLIVFTGAPAFLSPLLICYRPLFFCRRRPCRPALSAAALYFGVAPVARPIGRCSLCRWRP